MLSRQRLADPRRYGGAASGSEQALTATLAAIDPIYGIEFDHDANQDVASPMGVQEFWDERGQLPGFAAGG